MEMRKKLKIGRIIRFILLGIAAVVLILIGVLAGYSSKNTESINKQIDSTLSELKKHYTVTPRDPGEFKEMTMYGVLKFHTQQYDVEGLGNLSILTSNMGFMQMVSLIISPYEKAIPLFSSDFMYMLGNKTCFIEFYDFVPDPQSSEYSQILDTLRELEGRYADVENAEVADRWYRALTTVSILKKFTGKEAVTNLEFFADAIQTYMEIADNTAPLSADDAQVQWNNIQAYCNRLVDEGGVSTDVFKKNLGVDKTREFYNKAFFGMDYYR